MPTGSPSHVADECSLTQRKHNYLADSILGSTPRKGMDGEGSTSGQKHVDEDLLDIFQPSPVNRRFCLDSPHHLSSPYSWQDVSTEPLPTSNRPSPSAHHRQHDSPYASPLLRLEKARQARNKDPYHSPTRTSTTKRRIVTSAPQPLDFNNGLRTPDTQGSNKKQKILDLLDSTVDFPCSPLVLHSSQKRPATYYPPTPLTQHTPQKHPPKLDLFGPSSQSPGKENGSPLRLNPPKKEDLPVESGNTTLQAKDNDMLADRKQKVQLEMETLTKSVKTLRTHYRLVDKIGCGTFSSVFKAQDIQYGKYDNSSWETALASTASHPSSPKYVAIKQIHATSSPKRMAHEINILKDLRGASCVSQLITAFREHENVFLVMPYFRHNDFKASFRQMDLMDIKYYFRSLLTALKHLHGHGILHRDIKPNNFLYNMDLKSGMLIDFGLAQREDDTRPPEPPKSLSPSKSGTIRKSTMDLFERPTLSTKPNKPVISKAIHSLEEPRKPGYVKYDTRKSIKANRAGTRGFRAPEVLLRVTHQTTAIDIWSSGVILLSLLTGRYPFFIAHDEGDSLIEIANLFGLPDMKECAALHNRTFETNIKTIPTKRKSLTKLCKVLNTEKFKWWMEKDPQQVIHAIDLLEKLLALDHRHRITAAHALSHPFLSLSLAPHSRSPSPRRRRYSRSPSYSRSRSPYSSRSRSFSSRSSYSSRSRSPSPRRRRGRSPPSRRRSITPPRRQRSSSYRRRSPTPPPPIKPNRLIVTQLTRNVTKGHIEEIFKVYGPLVEVDFPKNRKLHANTGRAFVEFETVEDAEKAICHMDGGQLDGQVLAVAVAPPRPRRPPPRPVGRYRSPMRRGFGGNRRGRDSYVGGGRRYGRSRSRSLSPPPRYRGGRRYSRSPISRSRSPISRSRSRSYSPARR